MHVVSGQLKQPHVLVGYWIKGATGQQDQRDAVGGHHGLPPYVSVKESLRKVEEVIMRQDPVRWRKQKHYGFGCLKFAIIFNCLVLGEP